MQDTEYSSYTNTDGPENGWTFRHTVWSIVLIIILIVIIGVVIAVAARYTTLFRDPFIKHTTSTPPIATDGPRTSDFTRFSSKEDFIQYLGRDTGRSSMQVGGGAVPSVTGDVERRQAVGDDAAAPGAPLPTEETQPTRTSRTNVQVKGIDEPDIVKTDGSHLYISEIGGGGRPIEPAMGSGASAPSPRITQKTSLVEAFPPENMSQVSSIDESGDLLRTGDSLIVLHNEGLTGFNVADPASPSESWNVAFEGDTQLVQARMYDGTVYVVTRDRVSLQNPRCPRPLLSADGESITVPCTDIYHPERTIPAEATYHVSTIDPESGSVSRELSFVGTDKHTTVYMSPNALYVAYQYRTDMIDFFYGFATENRELFSEKFMSKLDRLRDYDLSQEAKLLELRTMIERYQETLDDDEKLKTENELANRMRDYMEQHKRAIHQTDIVKTDISSFEVAARGAVPGRLLNQFSLDEHQGHLRVATTIGDARGMNVESENDVYVLDENLRRTGAVQGLGVTEEIYAVRFMGDIGYVVTFREIDPFFVIDLSDPSSPQVKGELKIPGFSSYLHPVTQNRVVGIGEENGQVKLSLFDVSDKEDPKEVDNYHLKAGWSAVRETHHAFLLDDKHKVFFLPASSGGFIFSYEGGTLTLKKAVSNINARRAVYMNDYMYIVGSRKIVVIDETTWNRVATLDLE